MKDKTYSVEVLEKYSHGKYGKTYFFGLCVSATSKKSAETFAEELVNEMDMNEFLFHCIDESKETARQYIFGMGMKKPELSFKAYIGC